MKKKILDAVINELNKTAKAYRSGLRTLDTDNTDGNDLVEIDDISQKDQSTDISDDLQVQAAMLDNTIDTLKGYKAVSLDELSPGALVETAEMYLLVGVSLPPLQVNGKKVIGLTEGGKIYPSLKGKKKGDKFELGTRSFSILSIQ